MQLINIILLALFGLTASAMPTNTTLAEYALRSRATDCQNDCTDTFPFCTKAGTFASSNDLQKLITGFCSSHLGSNVGGASTVWNNYALNDGINAYLAVRHYKPTGSWNWNQDVCNWGFGGVLTGCQSADDSCQGGYAWMGGKGLTFVLGIDGNQATTFCDILGTEWC